jgi:mono/diheme cytochrome c family protein
MIARWLSSGLMLLVICTGVIALCAGSQADSDGWQIPAAAATEANPIAATTATLAKGQEIYKGKCQKCHGVTGTGNGPDADPDQPPGNLTDVKRAARNPDGVMFYKIWNGRTRPKMPAFKTDISREDVWTVIHYVKTLRR